MVEEGANDVSEGLDVAFGHAVELWGVRGGRFDEDAFRRAKISEVSGAEDFPAVHPKAFDFAVELEFQALDDANGVGGGVGLAVEGGRPGVSGGVVGDEEHVAGAAAGDRFHIADVDVKEFDGCDVAGGGGCEGAAFHFALCAGVAGFIIGEERGGGEVGGRAMADHVLEAMMGWVAEAGVEGSGRLMEFGADGADDLDFFGGERARVETTILVADLGGEAGAVGARRVRGGREVVEAKVFGAREEEGVCGVGGRAAGAAVYVSGALVFGYEVEEVVFEGIGAKEVSGGVGGVESTADDEVGIVG
ncbi:hypothetical protein HDU67_003501, partial [Dinochytrium kinnereticum]